MSSWQRPVRIGVGIFGLAFAVVVYLAIGERQAPPLQEPVERVDPTAVIESTTALLQQVRDTEQDFEVKAEQTLSYQDGSTKQFGVRITVRNRSGRDFVVVTREAQAGANQRELQLTGEVKVNASDGFEMLTDQAVFSQDDGIVRASGSVSFSKGRMRGSGVGMAYDKNSDVLTILDRAEVTLTDGRDDASMSFVARTAVLDRVQDFVRLDGASRVRRGMQTLDSGSATARLSSDEQVVTLIELRGDSHVEGGGGSLHSMTARDIDLDYTDDGESLERVVLTGGASVEISGTKGGDGGRRLEGDALDFSLAADGSITRALGRDRVRLDLPAGSTTAARSITAQTFDATGREGEGLTAAHFVDEVEYRELAGRQGPQRVARSRDLKIVLSDNDLRSAVFSRGVTFEERNLSAVADQARYDPGRATLVLTGGNGSPGARVTDEQLTVTAPAIDVALQTRRIDARGGIRTTLSPTGSTSRAPGGGGTSRLPGLLRQDSPANVNAMTLRYDGSAGSAVYSGNATLWQGETSIRGDVLEIDQDGGDLVAIGSARSTLTLDGSQATGRAAQIRYNHMRRLISYESMAAAVGADEPARSVIDTLQPASAHLTGPQGDLQAERIEVLLAPENGRARQLDAFSEVTLKVDARTANSSRLTYHAADERYVLTGSAIAPVRVVESCRETVGKTLTFFRSTDRILVDGNEEIRTQTKGGGPCVQPSSR